MISSRTTPSVGFRVRSEVTQKQACISDCVSADLGSALSQYCLNIPLYFRGAPVKRHLLALIHMKYELHKSHYEPEKAEQIENKKHQ